MNSHDVFLLAGENRLIQAPTKCMVFVYPFGKEKLLSYCLSIGEDSPYVKRYETGDNTWQFFLEKLMLPDEKSSEVIQVENEGNSSNVLSYVGDMAGRGIVEVFEKNTKKEQFYVHLDEKNEGKQEVLKPVAFLESVRAGDFEIAKEMLSDKLVSVLSANAMRDFFSEIDEVLCLRIHKKNIFATFGKSAKMFEFIFDENQKIDNISELD